MSEANDASRDDSLRNDALPGDALKGTGSSPSVKPAQGEGASAPEGNQSLRPEDFYMEGQYLVFTAAYHLRRGSCCHSDCRHCPYKVQSFKALPELPPPEPHSPPAPPPSTPAAGT